jgi:TetR/AcrR family transcriptional regulator, transcriptional repressor of bet genes
MPKIVDHDERRRAIAAAAVAAIAAEGLEGVKLTQIARAAGVTTGAVTHYFKSKDDVLLAALEHVAARLYAKLDEADAYGSASIFDVLPLDPESLGEWKVWLAFWGRAAFAPRLAAVHRQHYRAIEDGLATLIRGEPDAAKATAAAIIAAIDGVGTRVCLEPELWPAERQRALLKLLIDPLLPAWKGNDDA